MLLRHLQKERFGHLSCSVNVAIPIDGYRKFIKTAILKVFLAVIWEKGKGHYVLNGEFIPSLLQLRS